MILLPPPYLDCCRESFCLYRSREEEMGIAVLPEWRIGVYAAAFPVDEDLYVICLNRICHFFHRRLLSHDSHFAGINDVGGESTIGEKRDKWCNAELAKNRRIFRDTSSHNFRHLDDLWHAEEILFDLVESECMLCA